MIITLELSGAIRFSTPSPSDTALASLDGPHPFGPEPPRAPHEPYSSSDTAYTAASIQLQASIR